MIPIALRSTEEFLVSVPGSLREGAMALGATKWQNHRDRGGSGGHARTDFWYDAEFGARGRGNGSLAFYRAGQPILEPRLDQPTATLPVHDLHLRHVALSGLAPASLGGRIRAAHDVSW